MPVLFIMVAAACLALIMAAIAESLTEAWREAEPFEQWRRASRGIPFVGKLMACGFCLSAWIIGVTAFVAWLAFVVLGYPDWGVAALLAAAPAWRLSHLIHDIIKLVEAAKVNAQNQNIDFLLQRDAAEDERAE